MTALSTAHDKRRRRTRSECQLLRDQIASVLQDDHPQSVRHVFHRMTDLRLQAPVEKSDRGEASERAGLLALAAALGGRP
jgi:hypothetical protein